MDTKTAELQRAVEQQHSCKTSFVQTVQTKETFNGETVSKRLLIMGNGEHILISLASRHAENIFAGPKLVEVRRRTMNVVPGTTVWIYVKLPVGSTIGRVKVGAVHVLSPTTLCVVSVRSQA